MTPVKHVAAQARASGVLENSREKFIFMGCSNYEGERLGLLPTKAIMFLFCLVTVRIMPAVITRRK